MPVERLVPAGYPTASRASITRQFSLWPFGTRAVRLYLLLDPAATDQELAQGVLRAMEREYFSTEARSQTNALRSMIYAAHYVLRSLNERALPHERASAAAACAVTRGSTIYVALAGDAAALARVGEEVRLHRVAGRAARPLGGEALPRVSFWSAPFGPGDRLVLACGAAWQDDSADLATGILRRDQAAETAQGQLAILLAGSDGPARVLVADGPLQVDEYPHRARRHSVPGVELAAQAAAQGQPSALPERVGQAGAQGLAEQAQDRLGAPSSWKRPSGHALRAASAGPLAREQIGQPIPRGGAFEPRAAQATRTRSATPTQRHGQALRDGVRSSDRPRGDERKRAEPRPEGSRRTDTALRPRIGRWTIAFALILVLGVGAGAAIGGAWRTLQRPPDVEGEITRLLTEAERVTDPDQAYPLAARAHQLATEATALDARRFQPLLDRATERLRTTAHVYSLDAQVLVAGGEQTRQVAEIAVGTRDLFALHPGEGTVRRFDLARTDQPYAASTVVARSGTPLQGEALDVPIAIAWRTSDPPGTGSLAVIDRRRAVAHLAPATGRWEQSRVDGSTWRQVGAVSSSGEGLWVLDSEAGRLLLYPRGSNGALAAQPRELPALKLEPPGSGERLVECVPLQDLYCRDTGGRVHRFDRQGTPLPFAVRAPDGPLGVATGLASDRRGGLYLADASAGRIVQVGADGRFIRQLRPTDPRTIAGLRSLRSAPDGQRLLFVAEQGILTADLPPDPPTPRSL